MEWTLSIIFQFDNFSLGRALFVIICITLYERLRLDLIIIDDYYLYQYYFFKAKKGVKGCVVECNSRNFI